MTVFKNKMSKTRPNLQSQNPRKPLNKSLPLPKTTSRYQLMPMERVYPLHPHKSSLKARLLDLRLHSRRASL